MHDEAPDCPVCGSSDIRPGGHKLWCGGCGHGFLESEVKVPPKVRVYRDGQAGRLHVTAFVCSKCKHENEIDNVIVELKGDSL